MGEVWEAKQLSSNMSETERLREGFLQPVSETILPDQRLSHKLPEKPLTLTLGVDVRSVWCVTGIFSNSIHTFLLTHKGHDLLLLLCEPRNAC